MKVGEVYYDTLVLDVFRVLEVHPPDFQYVVLCTCKKNAIETAGHSSRGSIEHVTDSCILVDTMTDLEKIIYGVPDEIKSKTD